MSAKSTTVTAPVTVGLPGPAAAAVAAALEHAAVRVTAVLVSAEGPRVELLGDTGVAGRAAYNAALGFLELIGEEATVRLQVEVLGEHGSLAASAAAASLAALSGLLGVAPDPSDAMSVANRAVAVAAGRPHPPHVAAALLGGLAAGSEAPAYMASLPVEGMEGIYFGVVRRCKPIEEPEICVAADRYSQLVQALAVLAASIAARGWRDELGQLLRQENPWEYAAHERLREALRRALDAGALAAGIDPYTHTLVALGGEAEAREAAERMAAVLAAWQGCKPSILVARLRREPLIQAEAEAEG